MFRRALTFVSMRMAKLSPTRLSKSKEIGRSVTAPGAPKPSMLRLGKTPGCLHMRTHR